MILIKQRVVDGSMLRLISQSLKVGVAYQGKIEPTTVGVPQGSPISPLYSNIYLNLLDQVWHRRGYPEELGAPLHRYARSEEGRVGEECGDLWCRGVL